MKKVFSAVAATLMMSGYAYSMEAPDSSSQKRNHPSSTEVVINLNAPLLTVLEAIVKHAVPSFQTWNKEVFYHATNTKNKTDGEKCLDIAIALFKDPNNPPCSFVWNDGTDNLSGSIKGWFVYEEVAPSTVGEVIAVTDTLLKILQKKDKNEDVKANMSCDVIDVDNAPNHKILTSTYSHDSEDYILVMNIDTGKKGPSKNQHKGKNKRCNVL